MESQYTISGWLHEKGGCGMSKEEVSYGGNVCCKRSRWCQEIRLVVWKGKAWGVMGWKLESLFEIWYLSFFLIALSPLPFKIFCNITLITLVYLPHQFSKCLFSFLITIYLRYYTMTFNEIMHTLVHYITIIITHISFQLPLHHSVIWDIANNYVLLWHFLFNGSVGVWYIEIFFSNSK